MTEKKKQFTKAHDLYADQYDFLSDMPHRPVDKNLSVASGRYEYHHKSARMTMRLPEALLRSVKHAAMEEGIPYQRFIRQAIEEKLKATDK